MLVANNPQRGTYGFVSNVSRVGKYVLTPLTRIGFKVVVNTGIEPALENYLRSSTLLIDSFKLITLECL